MGVTPSSAEVTNKWSCISTPPYAFKNVDGNSFTLYEGWNFNSDNYLFTTDTK